MQNEAYFKNIKQAGFTLVEIGLVLLISGIMALVIAQTLRYYTITSQEDKTLTYLRETQSALFEYYARRGVYPCPADPTLLPDDLNYGLERCRSADNLQDSQDNCTGQPDNLSCTVNSSRDGDQNGAADVVMIGIIPFRTLYNNAVDIPYTENERLDGYGHYFSYAVTEAMTDSSRYNLFRPASPNSGAIRVVDENGLSLTTPDDSAHYTLYSHGENGRGGFTTAGALTDNCFVPSVVLGEDPALPAPGINAAATDTEIENCDNNDAIFVKGIASLGTNAGFNDDILFFKATGHTPLWLASLNAPSANESFIYNTNQGNVGVGTDNPTHKLHVLGDTSVEGSTLALSYCDGVGSDCLLPAAIGGEGSICPNLNEVAYAIQDNSIVCREVDWVMPEQSCDDGEFLRAFSNLGTIRCAPLP